MIKKHITFAIRSIIVVGLALFASCAAHAQPTQDQVDDLRDTIRTLEDQAQAIKDASDDPAIQTAARAIERIGGVAKTLGVQLDRWIDEADPVEPPVDPPIVLPPDPPTDDGWLASEPDADAIRLDANTTADEARAAINSTRDVLFEAGAVYNFSLGRLSRGGTEDDPRIIGVYGDGPRPQFVVSSTWLHTQASDDVSHLVIVGLHLTNRGRVPGPDFDRHAKATTGISWLGGGGGLVIEDCLIEGFRFGIVVNPQQDKIVEGLTLNRCIIRNCWDAGGDSSGALIKAVRGGVVNQCVFDHNGWIEGVVPRDPRRHNLYLSPRPNDLADTRSYPWAITGNLFSYGSSHGMKGGPGGIVEDNLWIGNAIAFYVSRNDSTVRGNVILDAADLGPTDALARGWGFEAFGMSNVTVENNIVANQQSHRPEASAAYAIHTHGIAGDVSGNQVFGQPRGGGDRDGVVYRAGQLDAGINTDQVIRDAIERGPGEWSNAIEAAIEQARAAAANTQRIGRLLVRPEFALAGDSDTIQYLYPGNLAGLYKITRAALETLHGPIGPMRELLARRSTASYQANLRALVEQAAINGRVLVWNIEPIPTGKVDWSAEDRDEWVEGHLLLIADARAVDPDVPQAIYRVPYFDAVRESRIIYARDGATGGSVAADAGLNALYWADLGRRPEEEGKYANYEENLQHFDRLAQAVDYACVHGYQHANYPARIWADAEFLRASETGKPVLLWVSPKERGRSDTAYADLDGLQHLLNLVAQYDASAVLWINGADMADQSPEMIDRLDVLRVSFEEND